MDKITPPGWGQSESEYLITTRQNEEVIIHGRFVHGTSRIELTTSIPIVNLEIPEAAGFVSKHLLPHFHSSQKNNLPSGSSLRMTPSNHAFPFHLVVDHTLEIVSDDGMKTISTSVFAHIEQWPTITATWNEWLKHPTQHFLGQDIPLL
jgi:hypothetical protein